MYLEKFKESFTELQFEKTAKSCTEQEIQYLEKKIGMTLPSAYREFLLWGGYNCHDILNFSDCSFEMLLDINEVAIEMIEEDKFPQTLPKDAFVFCMHQGYQFMFFRISEGDDPPLYFYQEYQKEPFFTKSYEHFSEFPMAQLNVIKQQREDDKEFLKRIEKLRNVPDFWEQYRELYTLIVYINTSIKPDEQAIIKYIKKRPDFLRIKAINEGKNFLSLETFPLEQLKYISSPKNIFKNETEARRWLQSILEKVEIASNQTK